EARELRWTEVDLTAEEIRLPAERVKTRAARTVDLRLCPSLLLTLRRLKARAGECPFVFGIASDGGWRPVARGHLEQARLRLWRGRTVKGRGRGSSKRQAQEISYGAPRFEWQTLRRTCATFHANMPNANIK